MELLPDSCVGIALGIGNARPRPKSSSLSSLLFTLSHIQTFPMCPVISCKTNLPPRIQPIEESKPGMTFPGNKNTCSMGN